MKLPTYSELKPSGIDWFGEVPKDWVVTCLRRFARRYSGGTPESGNERYWENGTIPWINSGAVNQGLISEPSAFITTEGFQNSSARWVPKDALVMALAGQGKTKGMVAQVAINTTCNQSMAAICAKPSVVPRYLYWLLASQYSEIRNMAGGEARDGLNLDILGSIPILIPKNEQSAIADFLGRATAGLDTLVGKKRELIEKLKEKRTALISRTVTKGLPAEAAAKAGLNPHPKLKPSGIEWLGDIPEQWRVTQLRRTCLILDCKHKTVSFVDDGIPLASIREVHGFELDLSTAKMTTEEEYLEMIEGDRKPRRGDIIYSRNATVGDAALVTTDERFCMGQDVCLLRGIAHVPRFLLYLFRSSALMQQVESLMIGSTFRRINVGQIKDFLTCVPTNKEQLAIADYLDGETAKIDRMIEKVEAAVDKLQEYRTALITAAVTGKIDVRAVDR